MSNLKQLGLCFIQYVQDYDEKWPGGADHWAGQIYPYSKSVGLYQCPDDPTESTATQFVNSYAMNGNLRGRRQEDLTDPSSTVFATDFDGTPLSDFTKPERISPYTTGTTLNSAWGGVRLGTTNVVANPTRHDPLVAFLGADGHVKLLRPEKVSSGIDNPSARGAQDAVYAAGTKLVSGGTAYTLTFSER